MKNILLLVVTLADGEAVKSVKAWDGQESRIQAPEYHRVLDLGAWEALWERHAGKKEKPPEVDFQKHMVLAIFEGYFSNNDCTGSALRVARAGSGLIVTHGRCSNEVAGPLRTPFMIRVVERSEGKVVVRHQEYHKGVWGDEPGRDLHVFEPVAAKK